MSAEIIDEENLNITKGPSEVKLKMALHSIPKDRSPSPDGFGSNFYIACWEFIKDDLMEAIAKFIKGPSLPRFFSTSFIVLIPKVANQSSFDKFIPIRLYSVAYKIFSKIIVNKLFGISLISFHPCKGNLLMGEAFLRSFPCHKKWHIRSIKKL